MGGKSEQTTTTTQDATTAPWEPAQPLLKGILGQLNGYTQNPGINTNENNALNQLSNNASQGNPYAGRIGSYADSLLAGGGAMDQANNVRGALDTYRQQLTPFANGSMVGKNSGLIPYLQQIQSDVTNDVNSQFAAAGRDFSGANQMALARGVAAGQAPVIANQYNQDVQNQLGAANSLYGAANSTAGMLSGMQQQKLTNQGLGVAAGQAALDAKNYGPMQQLAIEQQRRNMPLQTLGLLANIGVPIASLGSQSHGTGMSNTEKQMSGAEQFATISGGLGNLSKFLFSDRRLKEDVEPIGKTFDGHTIYRYRYLDSPAYHIGFMAQEVEKFAPEAVSEVHGYKTVNYKIATDSAIGAA